MKHKCCNCKEELSGDDEYDVEYEEYDYVLYQSIRCKCSKCNTKQTIERRFTFRDEVLLDNDGVEVEE